MKRGVYEAYRSGDGQEGLADLLRRSVALFYRRHGCLPQTVVVHKSQLEKARKGLEALDLSHLSLITTGGCLVQEVWLGLPDEREGRV